MLYVFDLDGTICDISHRLHFIGATENKFVPFSETTPKEWDKFHAACVDDKPIFEVITVARALHKAGHTLVYSTGREDGSRSLTVDWLMKYKVPLLPSYSGLYMRKYGDHREDYVVKSELLDQILEKFAGYDIGGAFEDRQQVVDMYRSRGIKVFQVAPGKF